MDENQPTSIYGSRLSLLSAGVDCHHRLSPMSVSVNCLQQSCPSINIAVCHPQSLSLSVVISIIVTIYLCGLSPFFADMFRPWICFFRCLYHNRLLPVFVISFFTSFVVIAAYFSLRYSSFSVAFIHRHHVLLLFITWFIVIVPPLHSSKSFVDVFSHIVCRRCL